MPCKPRCIRVSSRSAAKVLLFVGLLGKPVWKREACVEIGGKTDPLRRTSVSSGEKLEQTREFCGMRSKTRRNIDHFVVARPAQSNRKTRKRSDFRHFKKQIHLCRYKFQKNTLDEGKTCFIQEPLLLLIESERCWCAVTSGLAATLKG